MLPGFQPSAKSKEILLWALRKRRPWRVSGASMLPAFADQDLVLINPGADPQPGDVVVARHPFKNLEVIKYVHSVDDDDHLTLRSPSGDDSRQFGRVPMHTVRGVVAINLNDRKRSS